MSDLLRATKYDNQAKTLEEVLNAKEMYIHEGPFHMDDVMCAAMIIKLQEKEFGDAYSFEGDKQIEIHRQRYNIPNDFKGVICDCPGGYFDHHGALVNHRNGSKEKSDEMASMGCLNSVIGEKLFGKDKFEDVDNVIRMWDQADLGHKSDYLSLAIGRKTPLKNEEVPKQFDEALKTCLTICDVLGRDKVGTNDYNFIIRDYIDSRIKNPLVTRKFNEVTSEVDYSFDDTKEFEGLEPMDFIPKYLQKNAAFGFKDDINDSNSSLRQVLDRMDENEAKDFIFNLLDSERYYSLTQKSISNALEEVKEITKASGKEINVLEFDGFPGDTKVFDGSSFKFLITPQLESSELAVYAVGSHLEGEKGAPIPNLGFPVKYQGNINLLRESNNKLNRLWEKNALGKLTEDERKDIAVLTNVKAEEIDKIVPIANSDALCDYINEKIESNQESISYMEEHGISFIHKDGFLCQVNTLENAEKLLDDLNVNEEHLKYWNAEKGRIYLRRLVDNKKCTKEEASVYSGFFDENAKPSHNNALLKFLEHGVKNGNISTENLKVLDKSKYCANAISMETESLFEANVPVNYIEQIIDSKTFTKGDLTSICEDYKNDNFNSLSKEEMLEESIRLLKFKNVNLDEVDRKQFAESLGDELNNSRLPENSKVKLDVAKYVKELETAKNISNENDKKEEDLHIGKANVEKIVFAKPPADFDLDF